MNIAVRFANGMDKVFKGCSKLERETDVYVIRFQNGSVAYVEGAEVLYIGPEEDVWG